MAEQKLELVAKQLNESVTSVLSQRQVLGFEKAYLFAQATSQLKQLLTPEYMKPIMELQGNRLGFKTDKDDKGGYPEATVKNCLIEAVLTGVQPYGNQFNIIAGNMYITKEGFGYMLANYVGLSYEIIPSLPRINNDKTSAAIVMKIKWNIDNSGWHERELDIPVKMNAYMGTDAVIGKATRKARAWLYNNITGSEISDGDASDNDAPKTIPITAKREPIGAIDATNDAKEKERILTHITNSKTLDELMQVESVISVHNLQNEYASKIQELSNGQ